MDKNSVVADNEQPCCSQGSPIVDFETAPESVRTQVPRTPSPNQGNGKQQTSLPYTVEAVEDISEVSNMDSDGSDDSNTSTVTIMRTNANSSLISTPAGHGTDDDEIMTFHAATNQPQLTTGGRNTEDVSRFGNFGNRQYSQGFPGGFGNFNVGGEAQPPRNPYLHQQRTNGIQHPNFAYNRTSNYTSYPLNSGVINQRSPQYQYSNAAGTPYQHSPILPTTNYMGYPQNPVVTNPRNTPQQYMVTNPMNTPQQYANAAGMQYPNLSLPPKTNYMGYHQNLGASNPQNLNHQNLGAANPQNLNHQNLGAANPQNLNHQSFGAANPQNLTAAGTNEQMEEECKGHEVFSFLQRCIYNLDLAFTNTPNAQRLTTCLSHLGQLSKIVLEQEEQFNCDFFRNEHANHNSIFCDVARKEIKERKKARKMRKSKKAHSTQAVSGESDTPQNSQG